MVRLEEFAVERWMDDHETWATHNLAETCCASISIDDLRALSDNPETEVLDLSRKQTYGAIRGSAALRSNIARLYRDDEGCAELQADNVLVTNGAIQANFLSLYVNIGPGDHVICHYPTYQALYSVPRSLGAEVSLWKAQDNKGWQLDLDELRALIRPNTKLIVINNPENPTGAVLSRETLQEIVNIARSHDIAIHSDEVYRPLYHSLPQGMENPPSILSFGYDKTIATGSMSKAFSLAGIRLGWIASRDTAFIDRVASARDYTLISVSQVDDQIATRALSPSTVHNLLKRNTELARKNLDTLEEFVNEFAWAVRWTRPTAGTTAFVQFVTRAGEPVDDVEFCTRLQKSTGVMLVAGSRCFGGGVDFPGYVRVGFVPEHQVLVDGLQALRGFMRSEYESVPAAVSL